jgi:septal ring factor EnvC (AmiA/AmiB activator)
MTSSLPHRNLDSLDEVAGHAVNAAKTAIEIIELDLIYLPPGFPDFELGSRIKVTQRGIRKQAERYRGEVRCELFQVVRSICDYARKNRSFSDKILGVDMNSSTGRKQVLTSLNLLSKDIGRIVSRLENVQGILADVRSKLSDGLNELGSCMTAYNKGCHDLKKQRQEQLCLRQQLDGINKQRSDIIWRIFKAVGIIALVAAGVGVGVGLCVFGGVAGVTLTASGVVLTTMLPFTALQSIAVGAGVGIAATGVGMATYAPIGFEQWKTLDDLSRQKQEIESRLCTTPDGAMDNIHDKLKNLDALSSSLHTQLGMIKSDWEQLQVNMKATIEKLGDSEKLVDADLSDILKEQIRDAQKSWGVVLQWAGALNDKPSQDVSCLEAALNAITMSS